MKTKKPTSPARKTRSGLRFRLAYLMFAMLPVFSFGQISTLSFEEAATLSPAQFEAGIISNPLYATYSGTNEKLMDRHGAFLRVGVSKLFDVKLTYSRLFYDKWKDGVNLFQVSPKLGKANGRVGLSLPFSIFFKKNEYNAEYGVEKYESYYGLSPRLIMTVVQNRIFELNITPMAEFLFDKGAQSISIFGLDIGTAFSSNFDKWSVRPEGGFCFMAWNADVFYWSIGISGAFRFGGKH
jgi:hypothetical protein